jgi:hypothetical protein
MSQFGDYFFCGIGGSGMRRRMCDPQRWFKGAYRGPGYMGTHGGRNLLRRMVPWLAGRMCRTAAISLLQ